MVAQYFTCARCKCWQQWPLPAYLDCQNYDSLLCNSCGVNEGQPLLIEWIQLTEPVDITCTVCLTRLWGGSGRAPFACVDHELVFCGSHSTPAALHEHHQIFHGAGKMTWKVFLIEVNSEATDSQAWTSSTSVAAGDVLNQHIAFMNSQAYWGPLLTGSSMPIG